MKRLGALKGSGKSGYYNFLPQDPHIHYQSGKGIKQPQNLSFPQLRNRGNDDFFGNPISEKTYDYYLNVLPPLIWGRKELIRFLE